MWLSVDILSDTSAFWSLSAVHPKQRVQIFDHPPKRCQVPRPRTAPAASSVEFLCVLSFSRLCLQQSRVVVEVWLWLIVMCALSERSLGAVSFAAAPTSPNVIWVWDEVSARIDVALSVPRSP